MNKKVFVSLDKEEEEKLNQVIADCIRDSPSDKQTAFDRVYLWVNSKLAEAYDLDRTDE